MDTERLEATIVALKIALEQAAAKLEQLGGAEVAAWGDRTPNGPEQLSRSGR